MLVFLNGNLVDEAEAKVSIWDSGYLYGDGIFTTLRIYSGHPIDSPAHHQRLRHHANLLDLPFTLTDEAMVDALKELVIANNLKDQDARARITITRSCDPDSPLPLDDLLEIETNNLITVGPLPANLPQWQLKGISVITLGSSFVRGNLPQLKTLNALPILLALRRAHAAGCPEAILIGKDGQLLEGIVSNIFLVNKGRLLTPSVNGKFLPGRTRDRIISSAAHLNLDLEEKTLQREHLNSAQEIFMTNSIREIVPVISVDGKAVGSGLPGPITRRLQDQYRSDINAVIGM